MPSEALFDKIKPLLLSIIDDKIRKYDEMLIRGEETIVEHGENFCIWIDAIDTLQLQLLL